MTIIDFSLTFHTRNIQECVDFYERLFGAELSFDCGWYVTLRFASDACREITLSFIHPDHSSGPMPEGGVTLNFMVEDVDAQFEAFQRVGIEFLREIGDQPWGDRSFTLRDPIGNILYIYSSRPMSEEYAGAVK